MRHVAPGFDLEAFLLEGAAEVDRALLRSIVRLEERLAAPELLEVVRHGVMTPGKRLRPLLCVAACRACDTGGSAKRGRRAMRRQLEAAREEALFDLAASLELIHAYSLMHDDLPCMDDAPLRRGRATPHIVFGEEKTVIAGATLIPAAALQAWEAAGALGCDDRVRREIVRELMRAAGAGGMVGGQALDLLAESRTLDAGELETLHGLKTGALLAAALRIGARAAGAGAAASAALDRYGRALGLAFQIVDDVLDATRSAEELGKNPSDLEMGKSTFVALHGLDEARARARKLADEARAALESAGLDAPALDALADFVVDRGR